MCENVNEEFQIKSRRPLKGILISVVCSIYWKTGRDTKCYIWLLVVLGLGEQVRECRLLLLQPCLFTQPARRGLSSKSPLLGRGASSGAGDLRGGMESGGDWLSSPGSWESDKFEKQS